MEQNCIIQLQLKARYLPYLVASFLLLQLIAPYKGWTILLVGLGGAWLLSHLWARSLSRGLELTREMRYGSGRRSATSCRSVSPWPARDRRERADLCTRALYSAHRPDETDQREAIHTWSQLRRRLWLARLLTPTPW